MLKDNINSHIAIAMKDGNKRRLETLRMIKTAFMEVRTEKGAKPEEEWTVDDEVEILNKLISERRKSIVDYRKVNRQDLIEQDEEQIKVISEFLPSEATEEEINTFLDGLNIEFVRPNFKNIMQAVKDNFKVLNGKMASELIQKRMPVK